MENETKKLSSGSVEHLAFEVGTQNYAIDIGAVREIRGWAEPSGMPDTEPHVMGVINLRGEVLPLIDLAAKLGLKTPEINERSVIIVVEAAAATVGLLVDSVSNIIAPAQEDMKPPPDAASNGDRSYVSALTLIDDKLTRILDLTVLLPESEAAIVASE